MAGSLNKVQLIGHLGGDPEVRQTTQARKVVTFRIATSETWKDKASGERKERTDWHTVVIFNENLAGVAERYLRKGSKAYVEGELKTRKWQDQAGQDRYSTEVVIPAFGGSIILLDRSERQAPEEGAYGSTRDANTYAAQRQSDRPYSPPASGAADMDDEIPF